MISIDLRTNLIEGLGVRDYEGCRANERIQEEDIVEIDYSKIINANLPPDIQIVAWAACPSLDFSARFNCVNRTYKYFFPRGDLNLDLINEGGSYLLGEHDFRNFCKMDVANGVVNYHRRITAVTAEVLTDDKSSPRLPDFNVLFNSSRNRHLRLRGFSVINRGPYIAV